MAIRLRHRRAEPTVPPLRCDAEIDIVAMRRRHVRAVVAIEQQIFPRPWSAGLYLSELAAPETRAYYVALVDGAVVGYAGCMLVAGEGHVTTIGVAPAWQGRRIGMRLLHQLATEARRRRLEALTLEVRVSNVGAQRLYRLVRLRPGRDPQELLRRGATRTRLVMWAHDVDTDPYGERLAAIEPLRLDEPTGKEAGGRARPAASRPAGSLVLGIETSCDETAAAVVDRRARGRSPRSSRARSTCTPATAASSPSWPGAPIVERIAAGASTEALAAPASTARGPPDARVAARRPGRAIDAVAATVGPGLVGALLVGVSTAKALALAWGVPFVGVNHLEGHLYAAMLEAPELELPAVVLLVVGRPHAPRRDGRRRAATGVLGGDGRRRGRRGLRQGRPLPRARLPGRARRSTGWRSTGDPAAIAFPRAMLDEGLRLLLLRAEDRRRQLRPRPPGGDERRRGRLVPGGGRRRARRTRPSPRRTRSGPAALCLAGGVAANSPAAGALRRGLRRAGLRVVSSRAARCAPTTPR